MAASHAATGALAGVALAGLATEPTLLGCGVAGLVGAGAALLPDLDHPESTATRSQGPVSRVACSGVRALSSLVWRATRTPGDDGGYRDGAGRHRHLSHTVSACAVVGVAVWVVSSHPVGMAVLLWLLISLGLRGVARILPEGRVNGWRPPGWLPKGLRAWLRRWAEWGAVSVLAAAVVAVVMLAAPPPHPVLLAAVVATGMVVHILGDWLTPAGVPLAWPLTYRGRRWWMFRSPLPFAAGDCWQERAVRWACAIGTPALGAWAIMG